MRVEKTKNDMFLSEYPSPSLFCKHSLGTFLSVLLLSACSPDNDALPGDDGGNTPSAALRIEVSASDFASAATRGDAGSNNGSNNPATRATDNGSATTFDANDRIGIIVLDAAGNLLSDNIPYKYNGGAWSFDNDNGEGKTAIYYDNKAATYLAYFPYDAAANGITSIDGTGGTGGLKAKFPPQYDQRTEAAYRASDLLVWSETLSGSTPSGTPSKTLAIAFTHAYSSLFLSPSISCKINGVKTTYIPSSVSDASFTIGTEPLLPYRADDGSYRIIVSPQTTSPRWLCAYGGSMHSGMMPSNSLTANTRYTLAPVLKDMGDYSLDKAQVGDFYCKSSDSNGTGYLIPGDIASLTENQQKDCLGIVYWLGDIKSDNYGLLDTRFPNGTHGLVVSLWEMPDPDNAGGEPKMTWTYGGYEYVNDWLSSATWSGSPSRPEGFSSIQITDRMQGYANTVALEEYNKYVENPSYSKNRNLRVKPIKGLAAFQTAHPAPVSSSGWYWPSVCELKQVCWGQGVTSQSTSGKSMLNPQIGKVGGTTFGNDDYWSSTERSSYDLGAWYVYFGSGYAGSGGNKIGSPCFVRPLLAF